MFANQPLFAHRLLSTKAFLSLFDLTQKASDKNTLAMMSNGIVTDTDMNRNMELRGRLQDALPDPSRVVVIDEGTDVEYSAPINALRVGKKATPDLSRLNNSQLDRSVVRDLFSDNVKPASSCCDGKYEKRYKNVFKSPPNNKPSLDGDDRMFGLGFDVKPSNLDNKCEYFRPATFKQPQESMPIHTIKASSVTESSIPTAITAVTTADLNYDLFRPIRVAIVNRITEDNDLSPKEAVSLNRIHDILAGSEDLAARTIITIANDLIASSDNRWSEEYKLMNLVTKMVKMVSLFTQ